MGGAGGDAEQAPACEVVTVAYRVVNESARETMGVASYNVSPPTAGGYFSKINCFCFTDQRLKAGEKRASKLVFIGRNLDADNLKRGFEDCLLSLLRGKNVDILNSIRDSNRRSMPNSTYDWSFTGSTPRVRAMIPSSPATSRA